MSDHGFWLGVGDVVTIRGRDLWLERGSLLFDGSQPLAAIFEAREAWLWLGRGADEPLRVLTSIEAGGLAGLPLAYELEQSELQRRFKRPVRIEAVRGGSLPQGEALLAEYRAFERVLYTLDAGDWVRAWRAEAVPALDVERY